MALIKIRLCTDGTNLWLYVGWHVDNLHGKKIGLYYVFNMIFLNFGIISYKVLAMLTQFYAGYIFTIMVISCVAYRCTNTVIDLDQIEERRGNIAENIKRGKCMEWRQKMDGMEEEDGRRQERRWMEWRKKMDGKNKEDGWNEERRWMEGRKNMDGKMERKKKREDKKNCHLICIYWETHKHLITGLILYINCLDKNQIMDGTQWVYCERRWWKSHQER